MENKGIDSQSTQHCVNCHARLAHDQRYCVECGTRRGSLPAAIERIVAKIQERGSDAAPLPGRGATPGRRKGRAGRARWAGLGTTGGFGGAARGRRPGLWSPNPISASLAVMAMLGFGVIVGDISGAQTLIDAASPRSIVVDLPPSAPATTPVVNAPTSSGGGSSTTTTATFASATSATPASTTTTSGSGSTPASGPLALPPVKHVFLIVLSNEGYAQTFAGASKDRYLNSTLPKQGELISNYYGVAGGSLANEIAMVSGQGPTQDTEADCPSYTPITGATKASGGQIVGSGCIYPAGTHNLAGQLTKDHATWKAYLEGLGSGPKAQLKDCGQPAIGGSQYAAATAKDPYVASRNPFAYFASLRKHSLCRRTEVPLTALAKNLKQESTTPSLSFIVPGACDDGSLQPCRPGAAAGLAPANTFLKRTLKQIEASPAYKASGLIMITFDHAPQTGPDADPSACCSTPAYPNLPAPATTTTPTSTTPATTPTTTTPGVTTSTTATGPYAIAPTTTPGTTTPTGTTPTATTPITSGGQTTPTGGGGQIGLLMISRYVKPGSSDLTDYFNHFSLLAEIEQLFKLHLIADADNVSLPRFPVELYDYHSSGSS
jgi:hypothetical protein